MVNGKSARLSVLLFFVVFFGCGRVPKGILSEKEMEAVLTDMLKAEAWIGLEPTVYRNDTVKAMVYESVFHKYNISREIYDTSLVWYGRNIDVYLQVCEQVLTNLEKQINSDSS
ncbi:MAG: DUF4296 domain-containing protein [Tannerellaceae bacterium]|jgi:hypothetical protein|nr:DUF4296 domain-containing protein [Tannerellaceae bacterium]